MSDTSTFFVQLQAGEPVAGVTIEAYVKCAKSIRALPLCFAETSSDGGELVGAEKATLQFRWLRSSECTENSAFCHFHPERKATLYCGFWRSELITYGYLFAHACHCDVECFAAKFHVQRQYWEKAQAAKKRSVAGECPHCYVEGEHTRCGICLNCCHPAILCVFAGGVEGCVPSNTVAGKVGLGQCNRDEAWTLVGTSMKYTPSSMDVGYRLQFQVTMCNFSKYMELLCNNPRN
jgi:hypothetical protein